MVVDENCVHKGQTTCHCLSLTPECPREIRTLETTALRPKDDLTNSILACQVPRPMHKHFLSCSLEGPASTQSSVLVPDNRSGMGSSLHCPDPVLFPKSCSWFWLQLSTCKEAAPHRGGHPSLWLSEGQRCLLQAENQHARANDNKWPVRMHQ